MRQLFFRGQSFFFLQLHLFSVESLACFEDFSVVLQHFHVVFVENFAVPVIFRKMFTDEVQKLSADVCLYIHAEGRIKPNYVSLSVLAAVLYGVSYRFLALSVG